MNDFTGYALEVGDLVVYAVQDKYNSYSAGQHTSTAMRMGRVVKFTPAGKVSIQRIAGPEVRDYHRTVTSVYPSVVYRHDGEIPEGWY